MLMQRASARCQLVSQKGILAEQRLLPTLGPFPKQKTERRKLSFTSLISTTSAATSTK